MGAVMDACPECHKALRKCRRTYRVADANGTRYVVHHHCWTSIRHGQQVAGYARYRAV